MFCYAVVGYLDDNTESIFRELWQNLSKNNITQYGVEQRNRRPHVTIADYDYIEAKKFIDKLEIFCREKEKVKLSLNILGTFIGSGTLFISPSLSRELLEFHNEFYNSFKEFNDNDNSFYLPGRWNPHFTIASRLGNNMSQAYKYCLDNIEKINGKLDKIALIEIEMNNKGIAISSRDIFCKELK